jgi:type IV secretion system protein VirB5
MPFQHKSTVYKEVEIPNPFREGQDKAFADILLDKTRECNRWRLVTAGMLGLVAVSVLFNIYALGQQKTVPVLVNVMPSGEAQYLGEVRQQGALQIPEAAIQFQVRQFVTNLRSVSTDPQVVYNNIDECYAMVTSGYEPVMTRALRSASPFELVGKTRRSVEVESVIKITGNSWQIDWNETMIESSAGRKTARMRALITVRLLAVTDATIKKNPLGIYIENFEMTQL